MLSSQAYMPAPQYIASNQLTAVPANEPLQAMPHHRLILQQAPPQYVTTATAQATAPRQDLGMTSFDAGINSFTPAVATPISSSRRWPAMDNMPSAQQFVSPDKAAATGEYITTNYMPMTVRHIDLQPLPAAAAAPAVHSDLNHQTRSQVTTPSTGTPQLAYHHLALQPSQVLYH